MASKVNRRLAHEIERAGYEVTRGSRGHYKVKAADGAVLTFSVSPKSCGSEHAAARDWRKFRREHPPMVRE